MRTKYSLTTAEARKMLDAVVAEATRRNVTASVAITDEAGSLLAFERMEGTKGYTAEMAIRKSQTAARLGRSTTGMAEALVQSPQNAAFFPDRLPMQGGLPVIYEGQCAGAIGVAGLSTMDQMEEFAAIGIAALGL